MKFDSGAPAADLRTVCQLTMGVKISMRRASLSRATKQLKRLAPASCLVDSVRWIDG